MLINDSNQPLKEVHKRGLDLIIIVLNFLWENKIEPFEDPFQNPSGLINKFENAVLKEYKIKIIEYDFLNEKDLFFDIKFYTYYDTDELRSYFFWFKDKETKKKNQVKISLTEDFKPRFIQFTFTDIKKHLYCIKDFISSDKLINLSDNDLMSRKKFIKYIERFKGDISKDIKFINIDK